jgi:hypothetical protein
MVHLDQLCVLLYNGYLLRVCMSTLTLTLTLTLTPTLLLSEDKT